MGAHPVVLCIAGAVSRSDMEGAGAVSLLQGIVAEERDRGHLGLANVLLLMETTLVIPPDHWTAANEELFRAFPATDVDLWCVSVSSNMGAVRGATIHYAGEYTTCARMAYKLWMANLGTGVWGMLMRTADPEIILRELPAARLRYGIPPGEVSNEHWPRVAHCQLLHAHGLPGWVECSICDMCDHVMAAGLDPNVILRSRMAEFHMDRVSVAIRALLYAGACEGLALQRAAQLMHLCDFRLNEHIVVQTNVITVAKSIFSSLSNPGFCFVPSLLLFRKFFSDVRLPQMLEALELARDEFCSRRTDFEDPRWSAEHIEQRIADLEQAIGDYMPAPGAKSAVL